MFEISEESANGFAKIILKNSTNRVEIIPNCGGILNAWFILHNTNWINVIQGYESGQDFKENCESKGFRSCKLSPYTCRIRNGKYNYKGVNYNIGKFGFDQHNIHGLVYDLPFEVINKEIINDGARLELELIYDREDQGFPFKYSICLSYILGHENNLTVLTKVKNHHDSEIPLADGWHPYFVLGGKIDDYNLKINSSTMLEFDDQLIPTGKEVHFDKFQNSGILGDTKLDNCFVLDQSSSDAACALTNKADKIKLEIFPENSYPYLQIYTPDHRSSIAIENLSAAPDAFNNKLGLVYLKTGEEKLFSTVYKVSKLD